MEGWREKRPPGREVEQLRIKRAQQADVVDAFAKHQQAIETEPHGQAVAVFAEQRAGGEAALADLDSVDVELAAFGGVGMRGGRLLHRAARKRGAERAANHGVEVGGGQRAAREVPEVELVGLTGVKTIDAVAAPDQAGAGEQDFICVSE